MACGLEEAAAQFEKSLEVIEKKNSKVIFRKTKGGLMPLKTGAKRNRGSDLHKKHRSDKIVKAPKKTMSITNKTHRGESAVLDERNRLSR